MYYNKTIKEKVNLTNFPTLIGSASEPESVIIGGIQEIQGLDVFRIEHSIDPNDKNSPRIDFILRVCGKLIAIEVNGFQHFSILGFSKGVNEYNYQWTRYIKKIRWCRKYKIPIMHINILFDIRNCTKLFRKTLYDFVSNGTFQSLIVAAIKNNLDVSVNITRSGIAIYDKVKNTDSLGTDDYINGIIEGVVLGQDKRRSIRETIIV